MTKMTDEALSEAMNHVAAALGHGVADELRAHIAALTAERDEAEKKRGFAESSVKRYEKRLGGDLRRWVKDDPGALPFNWTPVDVARLQSERDTLRERVTALEAENEAAQATLQDEQAAHAETLERMSAAESGNGGADAPSEPLHCCGTTTGVHRKGCPTVAALAPLGMAPPSEMDGLAGEMAEASEQGPECAVCLERGDFARLCCNGQRQQAAPAPTTPAAFATVRRVLRGRLAVVLKGATPQGPDAGEVALSLLERRMGAQDAALRKAMAEIEAGDGDPWMTLKAALTDAPPVFTLEEVEAAFFDVVCPDRQDTDARAWWRGMMERFTALRR